MLIEILVQLFLFHALLGLVLELEWPVLFWELKSTMIIFLTKLEFIYFQQYIYVNSMVILKIILGTIKRISSKLGIVLELKERLVTLHKAN